MQYDSYYRPKPEAGQTEDPQATLTSKIDAHHGCAIQ
jgi:hypothetical protein